MRSRLSAQLAYRAVAYVVGEGRVRRATARSSVDLKGPISEVGRGRRPRGSTSVRGLIPASLCALAGGLLLAGAPAQAAVTHNYLSRITEVPAEGPKGEAVPSPGPFEEATGLTVDSGELYVADGFNNSRLDKFNASSGAFISQFAQVPPPVYDLRQSVAVGHKTGETETYVTGDESGSETVGLVAVYGPTGALQALWKGADTPEKGFTCFECGPRGVVTVDNSTSLAEGDVYVSDPRGIVDVFKPEAGGGEKYVTQLTGPETGVLFNGVDSIAVNQLNGDLLVLESDAVVDVFEPTVLNEYVLVRRLTGTPGGAFERPNNIAVDGGNGDIYVAESERQVIDQFNSEGAYLGHMTGTGTPAGVFGGVAGLAVDPATHDVYVGDREKQSAFVDVFGPDIVIPDVTTESASNVKARSATLNGAVNPRKAGAATCQFVWGTSTSFGSVVPCSEPVADGEGNVSVSVSLSGLQPDTTYHYRLQASNGNGFNPGEASQDHEFTTPGPGIHGESASTVTSGSATLSAAIDPNNVSTTYYFQYGTSTSYGTSLPAPPGLELSSGKGDLNVSVHLQGLEAATTYHYRVVAISEPNGEAVTVDGPDETFTTQAAGGEFTQPDGRAWEMVSPPNKQGAGIIAVGNEQGSDIQAAADGSGITYTATASFVPNPAGNRALETTQVISNRQAPANWITADITTAHNEGASGLAVGHSSEYKLFSSDLSLGIVEPAGDTPLPPLPPGSEKTIYFRKADGGYEALVTAGNVPPGAKFGGNGEGAGAVGFVGAAPDAGHVVLSSNVALTSTPMPPGELSMVYEWAEGQLQLASILPNGEPTEASLGDGDRIVRRAISNDGSRLVLFPSHLNGGNYQNGHLELRDMVRKETVDVDTAQGAPEPGVEGGSIYRTANSEDSRVFFTSSQRLTAGSTLKGEGSEDLYEFEVTSGKGEPLAGKLTDLTVDKNAGEEAGVEGVIEASEDGSYVYFVATGVLGDAAEHGATSGNNLYVEHYDAGTKAWTPPTFIAALPGADFSTWGAQSFGLKGMISRASPNGRYLAFMSEKSLTGYENRDANSGVRDEEVFLYDANAGRLVCSSCNPTGARPVGLKGSGSYEERLWDFAELWGGRWVAGDIPGWTTKDLGSALYQSRYLSNSGRLFFNSSDALVPADVNGKEDVYEYEPAGVGSCQPPGYGQSASDVFVASIGGCVALISAGTSSEESAFMDASENGGDVFFLTLSRLSAQDVDTSIDLYDAHECSAASPCAPAPALAPPPCTTGDACKPAPTPQPAIFGEPASATFSGAGNVVPSASKSSVTQKRSTRAGKLLKALKACGKKPKRMRAACRRQARNRYGAKKSRFAKSLSSGTRR